MAKKCATSNNKVIKLPNKILELELAGVEGESVMLEEYAREMIYAEELHQGEVNKMLRKPGDVEVFKA